MPERIGVYPGTFDPVTHGHMDIVRRALHVVDTLIVAVAQDSGKDPLFDLETRTRLVREDVAQQLGPKAGRVEVRGFSGLLVNFAREQGATLIIRGLRAVSDFEYEFQMACMNAKLAPEIETVFLTASESEQFISSRFIRQIAQLGGPVDSFVSPNVAQALQSHYASATRNLQD